MSCRGIQSTKAMRSPKCVGVLLLVSVTYVWADNGNSMASVTQWGGRACFGRLEAGPSPLPASPLRADCLDRGLAEEYIRLNST